MRGSGQPARLHTSFLELFSFVQRKKCMIPPCKGRLCADGSTAKPALSVPRRELHTARRHKKSPRVIRRSYGNAGRTSPKMKLTLDYVFLFVTKGYFCSILISNIIFVFLSFVVCLCFFFSTTIKTQFLLFSNENTTFCLVRTSVAKGEGENFQKISRYKE